MTRRCCSPMPAWCSSRTCFSARSTRDYVRAASEPALRARRRQAQRPRERRLHRAAPHVLRDARQFLLRRLFQARGDPLRVGLRDRHARHSEGAALGHGVSREDDEAERIWTEEIGIDPSALHAHGREIQFLGDGRDRTLRSVQRDLLRPRPGNCGRTARIAGRGRRPLRRDLESRVHAVRPLRRRRR